MVFRLGSLRMNRLAIAVILGLVPAVAGASQQGVIATSTWKTMDKCAAQAQAAFPDFTPESNAKRDAQLKACLALQNLPPREPMPTPSR
jgi:hypothetical protein